MTIVSVKVGSRKESWIARAEEHFYKLGVFKRDGVVPYEDSARYMAELVFDGFVKSTDGYEYHYSPEDAVEEELSYWGE